MDKNNLIFLETYKRLDKLCRDIYKSNKGVSNYIDHMNAISSYECNRIPNWNVDLDTLIRLRKIRNRLTHEIDTLVYPMCTSDDIKWLESFHLRILNASDPLALHAKCLTRRVQKYCAVPSNNKPDQQKLNDWSIVLFCLLLVVGIAIFTIAIIILPNS